jgi:catalase
MGTCKEKKIIARQITIFREVADEIADGLEKATGVKGEQVGLEGMVFNGSHNGYGKKKTANGLKMDGGLVFDNGAPASEAARA